MEMMKSVRIKIDVSERNRGEYMILRVFVLLIWRVKGLVFEMMKIGRSRLVWEEEGKISFFLYTIYLKYLLDILVDRRIR